MKRWKLRAIPGVLTFFICLIFSDTTRAGTAPDALVVWGQPADGLQCGLALISKPGSNYPFVRIRIRNVGRTNVQVYDDKFPDLYLGLVTRDRSGAKLPGNFQAAFDPGGLYNGTRTVTTIAPDTMTSRIFINLHFHVTDPDTVEFDGIIQTLGSQHGVPMRCGPVQFHG
jgi:hypothetical protein